MTSALDGWVFQQLSNCGVPPLRIVVSSPNPHLSPRSEVMANSPPTKVSFHHRTVRKRLVALDVGDPLLVRFLTVEVLVEQARRVVHGSVLPLGLQADPHIQQIRVSAGKMFSRFRCGPSDGIAS